MHTELAAVQSSLYNVIRANRVIASVSEHVTPMGNRMRNILLILLLTRVIGCGADSPESSSTSTSQLSPAAEWINYSADDESFRVEFPGTPESWTTDFTSPVYGKIEVYHVSVEPDEIMLGVNYNDYPRELEESEIETELKNAYALPDTGAEILETTEVKVSDVAAIEVVSKTGPIYMVGRYFITDTQRLYSLQSGSTRDPRQDRSVIDHFFKSFELGTKHADSSGTPD